MDTSPYLEVAGHRSLRPLYRSRHKEGAGIPDLHPKQGSKYTQEMDLVGGGIEGFGLGVKPGTPLLFLSPNRAPCRRSLGAKVHVAGTHLNRVRRGLADIKNLL